MLSGCAPVLGPHDDVEYSLDERKELEALRNTDRLFDQMKDLDVVLYFTKEDFSTLINETFKNFSEHFVHLDAPGFSKVSFEEIQLHLSNQSARSRIGFSFEVDALKRQIFGYLIAEHKLQAGTDEFRVSTHFDEIILDRIDENEELEENSENRELIAASVKNFMHTLNIETINTPLVIPVDMNVLKNINGKDILSSADYKLHSARAVNMQTKMEIYLPYISEEGVVLLGASELKEPKIKESSENLAELHQLLKSKIDSALLEKMGISLETLQKYSSYYMSKEFLANQMNKALSKMDLRIINKSFLKIPEAEKHFTKDILFFDRERLPSCEGVKAECKDRLRSCEGQCQQKHGAHNCIQCDNMTNPFEQVRCISNLEACKSKEEFHLYECHKRENLCELENNEIQTSCDIENLNSVAQCTEKKEKLLFVNDEIVLAKLNIDFDIANSYAVQRIGQIIFDESLERLEVIRDIHISVDSKLKVGLIHGRYDDINCSLEMNEALLTHSQFDYVEQKIELPLFTQRAKDGKMMIKAISRPDFISVSLKNRPYEKLLQRKEFVLQCRYQGMPMEAISAGELLKKKDIPNGLDAMLGEIELHFEEEELSFVISPVKLGSDTLLYPTMEAKAVGFSRQANFY